MEKDEEQYKPQADLRDGFKKSINFQNNKASQQGTLHVTMPPLVYNNNHS